MVLKPMPKAMKVQPLVTYDHLITNESDYISFTGFSTQQLKEFEADYNIQLQPHCIIKSGRK